MRRAVVILGLLLGALAPASPASAHICSLPAHFAVHEQVNLNITVAAEDQPVRAVDISVPDGFSLTHAEGYLGFTASRRGQWVHFEGGEIAIYDCQSFLFQGRTTRSGRLVAHIVTTAADGTKTHYDDVRSGSHYPAQVIYVGAGSAPAQHTPSKTPIQLAIVIVAGAALFALARKTQRRRADG
ncbi:MAG TPA: hypothetical protein VHC63_07030 [Acidimicrobiales bacterium]|nr:hypothetical protein [Acidimicrobiales bacterium]